MLDANIKRLGERAADLAGLLADQPEGYRIEAVQARSGEPSATHRGFWLHSRYQPAQEAERLCAEALAGGADLLVCIGLGLGYLPRAALRQGCRVLVVEADPAWLRACLCLADLSQELSDERLELLVASDGEGLLAALVRQAPQAIAVVENPVMHHLFPDSVESYRRAVQRFREKADINTNTLRRFGRLWVRNIAKNLGYLASCPGVSTLSQRLAGMPAIVLAAGPSLDLLLPELHDLRQGCVLIAVDTALRSLLSVGVVPDFLVVVDPQFYNSWHLHYCLSQGSILISETAVWPSVLRQPAAATFLCSSLYPLGQAMEERSRLHKGRLGAGGSVATTAWDLARLLGCSPVYMAGLDLGFPALQLHARASLFEQYSLQRGRRLRPASHLLYQQAISGQPYTAPANNGGSIRTDKRLGLYGWWYSRTLAAHPETPTFNLSAAGLAIGGMPYLDQSELRRLPARRDEIDRALVGCLTDYEAYRELRQGHLAVLADCLEGIMADLKSFEGQAALAAGLASRAEALARTQDVQDGGRPGDAGSREGLNDLLASLDQTDGDLLSNKARDIAGFLFPDIVSLTGGRAASLAASLRNSQTMYRQIQDSAAWHRRLLEAGYQGLYGPA